VGLHATMLSLKHSTGRELTGTDALMPMKPPALEYTQHGSEMQKFPPLPLEKKMIPFSQATAALPAADILPGAMKCQCCETA